MVAAELKVVGGKHSGQVIPLNRRKFLIGREQDCQLRPNSDMVSRHHCVFSVDDFSVRLRDLGSTNGTLINGEKIRRETVLEPGDRIVIGNLEFEFVIRAGVAVESDSKVVSPVSLSGEETQVTSRTVLELPRVAPTPDGSQTQAMPAVTAAAESFAAPAAQAPAAPAPMAPPVSTNDTTVINPGQMMPGQYPYQPMMQPMGFPGAMYGGFPYQQPMMPGYGQMYPQMMPQMMPQMAYPMGGAYPQQVVAQEPVAAAPSAKPDIDVSLPDPSQTGAKETEAAKGSGGSNPKDSAKPTGAADAIIKQYMGRRPGT